MNTEDKVAFAIGTGRCGTKFLSKVLGLESNVSSVHERNSFNETFHRYMKWYRLDVDLEGFFQTKSEEIEADLKKASFSFEASAYLTFHAPELYERFRAKFIFLVRQPDKVVNSYANKGYYLKEIYRKDNRLPPGYQETKRFHHFLNRVIPSGEKFESWKQMSRIGKIAWYWNAVNERGLAELEKVPEDHWMLVKLEELNYEKYQEIMAFLKLNPQVRQTKYDSLSADPRSVNRFRRYTFPVLSQWSEQEVREFEREVKPMAERFGYEYRTDRLLKAAVGKTRNDLPPLKNTFFRRIFRRLKYCSKGLFP